MKQNNKKNNQAGFATKIILPIVAILIIVGFVYWGTDESNRTSENPVAKGVAKFYAEVRQAVKPGSTRLDDYTIELPESVTSVSQRLEERAAKVQPGSPTWQGKVQKRSFEENDTIKTALENFARAEGIEVIWDLKYDYIIKNHFAEKSDLKSLVDKVSRVVATDYSGTVYSFYCPKERSIVISDTKTRYYEESCVTTKSARRLMQERERQKRYERERDSGQN